MLPWRFAMAPLLGPQRAAADVAGGDRLVDTAREKNLGNFGEIFAAHPNYK